MPVIGRGWTLGSFIACLLVSAGAARARRRTHRPARPCRMRPAPQQASPPALAPANPCELRNAAATMAATAAVRADSVVEADGHPVTEAPRIVGVTLCVPHMPVLINWYARFLNGPQVKALTPLEKAHLAARNLVDPFNLLTIAGDRRHFRGCQLAFGRRPRVSRLWQLHRRQLYAGHGGRVLRNLPDPLHRAPGPALPPHAQCIHQAPHRPLHHQIAWTEGDNGRGMVNYADLVGFAADESINNLFVPGAADQFSRHRRRATNSIWPPRPSRTSSPNFCPTSPAVSTCASCWCSGIINQVARTEPTASP